MKRSIILFADVIVTISALWMAFSLRYGEVYIPSYQQLWIFILAPFLVIPIFVQFGLYRTIVRYIGMQTLWTIAQATAFYALVFAVIVLLAGVEEVPRTVYGINAFILLVFAGGNRLIARWWFTREDIFTQGKKVERRLPPVLIYGAGDSGVHLATALKVAHQLNPVAFIDDDPSLINQTVNGLDVYAFNQLNFLIEKYHVSNLLLAMPSVSRHHRNNIIRLLEPYPIHVRTLPDISDLAEGKIKVSDIREVDIADLLGREQVEPIHHLLHENITNKVVMVTGAGGSIGSELCRQIIQLQPKMLILFELNEFGLYQIEKELKQHQAASSLVIMAILGSVHNQQRVETVCHKFNVDTIYHAAAYKHVPLVESNTTEGIRNNVFGTLHCAKAAIAAGVETFVLISTDKAVRPTNTMGASKRFAELVLQALAQDKQQNTTTRFTMVRFGNVLGSSGSVVPLFREQILNGGPVTVTDSRIIRYFMTIPEAAELVIQAGAMGQGGDVFVLDMGEPIRILDLAKRMIRLSGFTEQSNDKPDGDIDIVITGLRPGEKLYEELLIGDKVTTTDHSKIMRAQEQIILWTQLVDILHQLEQANDANDCQQVRELLLMHVDGFSPQCDIEDWLN